MMLDRLNSQFRLLAAQPFDTTDLSTLRNRFRRIPQEYIELIQEATEIEVQHKNGTYLRFWGPTGCVDMDEGYEISRRIEGAFPIGDDGGGRVIFYMLGKNGFGLYVVGFGDLDADDATWIAASLSELLVEAKGIEIF